MMPPFRTCGGPAMCSALGRHVPDDDGVLVGPAIAHHADRVHIAEDDAERLPGIPFQAGTTDLLPDDAVRGPDLLDALPRHLTDDPDCQSRSGEGLALDD